MKSLALKEGQFIYMKQRDFEEVKPFFINICECVALIINLKNGDKLLYHKSINDESFKFLDYLENLENPTISLDDVMSIKMFGGNFNNLVKPRTGTIIDVNGEQKNYNYKDDAVATDYAINDKKNQSLNCFIILSWSTESIVPLEDTTEEYFQEALLEKNFQTTYISRSGNECVFNIRNINEFAGKQNQDSIKRDLQAHFGDEVLNKITHQYTPIGASLYYDENGDVTIFEENTSVFEENAPTISASLKKEGDIIISPKIITPKSFATPEIDLSQSQKKYKLAEKIPLSRENSFSYFNEGNVRLVVSELKLNDDYEIEQTAPKESEFIYNSKAQTQLLDCSVDVGGILSDLADFEVQMPSHSTKSKIDSKNKNSKDEEKESNYHRNRASQIKSRYCILYR